MCPPPRPTRRPRAHPAPAPLLIQSRQSAKPPCAHTERKGASACVTSFSRCRRATRPSPTRPPPARPPPARTPALGWLPACMPCRASATPCSSLGGPRDAWRATGRASCCALAAGTACRGCASAGPAPTAARPTGGSPAPSATRREASRGRRAPACARFRSRAWAARSPCATRTPASAASRPSSPRPWPARSTRRRPGPPPTACRASMPPAPTPSASSPPPPRPFAGAASTT